MANGRLKNALGQIFYPSPFWPIGSIFLNTVNENPSKYFGGTWVSFGTGRCLVGVDTSQTEFNKVEKTGGEKTHKLTIDEMPKHKHRLYRGGGTTAGYGSLLQNTTQKNETRDDMVLESGGDQAHNNLQPYITVYMWKRTA